MMLCFMFTAQFIIQRVFILLSGSRDSNICLWHVRDRDHDKVSYFENYSFLRATTSLHCKKSEKVRALAFNENSGVSQLSFSFLLLNVIQKIYISGQEMVLTSEVGQLFIVSNNQSYQIHLYIKFICLFFCQSTVWLVLTLMYVWILLCLT